jgi:hypothetical protein
MVLRTGWRGVDKEKVIEAKAVVERRREVEHLAIESDMKVKSTGGERGEGGASDFERGGQARLAGGTCAAVWVGRRSSILKQRVHARG